MALREKPKKAATATKERPTQDESQVAALIQKGGSVATAEGEGTEIKNVQLRLPVPFLEQIDTSLATRRVRRSRHSWLLEAVVEKLDREG